MVIVLASVFDVGISESAEVDLVDSRNEFHNELRALHHVFGGGLPAQQNMTLDQLASRARAYTSSVTRFFAPVVSCVSSTRCFFAFGPASLSESESMGLPVRKWTKVYCLLSDLVLPEHNPRRLRRNQEQQNRESGALAYCRRRLEKLAVTQSDPRLSSNWKLGRLVSNRIAFNLLFSHSSPWILLEP